MERAETPAMAFNPAGWTIGPVAQDGGSTVRTSLTVEPAAEESPAPTRPPRSRGRRRPRVDREAAELGAMVARMLRALARRAETGDLEALVQLVDLQPLLTGYQKRAARGLTQEHGLSWAEIGLRLGVTKQAAHGRWGGS